MEPAQPADDCTTVIETFSSPLSTTPTYSSHTLCLLPAASMGSAEAMNLAYPDNLTFGTPVETEARQPDEAPMGAIGAVPRYCY